MKTAKSLLVGLLLFSVTSEVLAVQRRRGTRAIRPTAAKPGPAQPAPQPKAAAPQTASTAAPILLAVVNGQNITNAELDPNVREEVESLAGKIAEARRQILELEVNTLLLESEARKRKLSSQQLYDIEVARKVTEPGAAEVNKFIEDNRAKINESDPAALRQQVVAYLRDERESKASGEFVKKLYASNSVIKSADLNNANLPPSAVLATVGGRNITAAMLNERLKPIIYKLRLNTYLLEKTALDQIINDLLLLAEAQRRNVAPEEIVRNEISEKVSTPTEAEIAKFYADNKNRIKEDLDAVRSQLGTYLQEQTRQRLEDEFAANLRKGAGIRILISEPEPPVQSVSVDDDPARGDATAPITIVEFTDFQCPACAAMHPVLDEVIKSYGNKIRLVVRDFPLPVHANARKAAEAANAANAQGKFFEYAALLFKRQNALDVPSLKKYASELGLDRARFDAALDSGKFAAEVKHDISDGELYGVGSTPTIFVNGVSLTALSDEALRAAIDRALARSSSSPKASPK